MVVQRLPKHFVAGINANLIRDLGKRLSTFLDHGTGKATACAGFP
jgi:hypothetical protein